MIGAAVGFQQFGGGVMRCAGSLSAALGLVVAVAAAGPVQAGGTSPVPNGSSLVFSQPIAYLGYGVHYPQGVSAVQYLYGAEGTYKQYSGLADVQDASSSDPNYGNYCGWTGPSGAPNQSPTGVFGNSICPNGAPLSNLNAYATGANAVTVPDASKHALFDLAYNVATPAGTVYQSFEEHSGHGANGVLAGAEDSNFWFDDNWLARYVSLAYGAPSPAGLWAPTDFNRWSILEGGVGNFTPYSAGSYIDLEALNGLYYLYTGDYADAQTMWSDILSGAGTAYDSNNQRYSYPNVYSEYQLGLFKILTDQMLVSGHYTGATATALIQHSVSLHSDILSDEQMENGAPIGWLTGDGTTSRTAASSLINTETTSVQVLALGAGAKYTFEVGQAPMQTNCTNCYLRPYFAYSAVVGLTTPNTYMAYGPYKNIPTGSYTVDFYLRTPTPPSGAIAYLDVHDAATNTILASTTVTGSQMLTGNQWTRISLPVSVNNSGNSTEFRVVWQGAANLDVTAIRVR